MQGYTNVSIERDGVTYRGSFYVEDGEIRVVSAHGVKKAKLGKAVPAELAERLLGEIVTARGRKKF